MKSVPYVNQKMKNMFYARVPFIYRLEIHFLMNQYNLMLTYNTNKIIWLINKNWSDVVDVLLAAWQTISSVLFL